jgi:hypothetical protein
VLAKSKSTPSGLAAPRGLRPYKSFCVSVVGNGVCKINSGPAPASGPRDDGEVVQRLSPLWYRQRPLLGCLGDCTHPPWGLQTPTLGSTQTWVARCAQIQGPRSFRAHTRCVADASGRWVSDIPTQDPHPALPPPRRVGHTSVEPSGSQVDERKGAERIKPQQPSFMPTGLCSREQDREINGLIDVLGTRTPSTDLQTIESAAGSEIGPISRSRALLAKADSVRRAKSLTAAQRKPFGPPSTDAVREMRKPSSARRNSEVKLIGAKTNRDPVSVPW